MKNYGSYSWNAVCVVHAFYVEIGTGFASRMDIISHSLEYLGYLAVVSSPSDRERSTV